MTHLIRNSCPTSATLELMPPKIEVKSCFQKGNFYNEMNRIFNSSDTARVYRTDFSQKYRKQPV